MIQLPAIIGRQSTTPCLPPYVALVSAENLDDLVAFINGSDGKGDGKSKKKKKRKKKKAKRSSKGKEIEEEEETCCTGERKEQYLGTRDERPDRAKTANAALYHAAAPAQQIEKKPPEQPPEPLADKSSILVMRFLQVWMQSGSL